MEVGKYYYRKVNFEKYSANIFWLTQATSEHGGGFAIKIEDEEDVYQQSDVSFTPEDDSFEETREMTPYEKAYYLNCRVEYKALPWVSEAVKVEQFKWW